MKTLLVEINRRVYHQLWRTSLEISKPTMITDVKHIRQFAVLLRRVGNVERQAEKERLLKDGGIPGTKHFTP